MDNYYIKISADVIAEPLHHIIKLSIIERSFQPVGRTVRSYHFTKKNPNLKGKTTGQ